MKIVFLNPSGALGGAERSLLDVMASVGQTEPSAALNLIVAAPGPLVQEAEKFGVHVVLLPLPRELVVFGDSAWNTTANRAKWGLVRSTPRVGWATWAYVKKLSALLNTLEPDVVHSNGIKCHLLAGLAARRRWPVIWHIRDFLSSRPLVNRLVRWAAPRAGGCIAISRAVERDVRAVVGALPVELVPNGIDTDYFSPGKGNGACLDVLAGLPPTEPPTIRVGLVATYARWKGHELFLQAASRLERAYANVRFYLVGGPIYATHGSQYSASELRVMSARVSRPVGLIPFQDNPAEIYRSLDIVVHASTQPEPFGRTIIEAMACGRPVIVANSGGAAELYTDRHDALGFPLGDADALARQIDCLIKSRSLRDHIAANARRTAVARFDRSRLGPQILAAYRRILRASRAA
jgi:glycosyltransferase involved in cell wall biosynthesis